jgi:putative FmdB family regulatory protein
LPTYEYACTACGHRLEAVQKFTDDPLTECPECGAALRKVYGAVGIVLKGSGFYKTDSRAAGGNGSGKKNADAQSGDGSAGDSSSQKESSASDKGGSDKAGSDKGGSDKAGSDKGGSDKGGSGPSSSGKNTAPASSTAG